MQRSRSFTEPMADLDTDDHLSAGDFSDWLRQMVAAINGELDADVPCGSCTACCTSSQFIHIGPSERDALAHIPSALLFPAPRMPRGHVLMGYDEHGRCPMLIDNLCSIYDHRPRTCRTYDCRVFPAAGVELDEVEKEQIAAQVRRWQFDHSPTGSRQHDAVKAAARFLQDNAASLGEQVAPHTATQLAVAAVEVHALFGGEAEPDVSALRVELSLRRGPT